MRIKQSLIICFGMALVLMTIGTAASGTFTVNNSTGPVADFTSIQAAVNATVDGDIILVYPGTYNENVDVNKQLNITSTDGSAATHVTAASSSDDVFEVTADGVTISGFHVSGGSSAYGIYLHGIENCIVINNKVSNTYDGIHLWSSSNSTLISNTASNNSNSGIHLFRSSNNTLISNTANLNNNDGIRLFRSSNNTLTNNKVSNNIRGIYLRESSNNNTLISNTASNNFNGIFLLDSSYNELNKNAADSNYNYGIMLKGSNNNTLISNTVSNNTYDGIKLFHSSNSMLTNNTASNNSYSGICISFSSNNNTLISNTASNNTWAGIYMSYFSDNSTLTNNTANSNNNYGISLSGSNSTLRNNHVNSNNKYGIILSDSSDNLIYNNHFNNSANTHFSGKYTGNVWNITKTAGPNIIGGPYLGGNYWAKPDGTGFSQINVDIDCDGFCDSPLSKYELDTNNIDYLPLYLVTYNPYDKNEDYVIDIGEVSAAIDDYRTQGTTSIADISELIDMYRSGGLYC